MDPGKWESTQIMWPHPSLPAWGTSSLSTCLLGSAACFSVTEVRRSFCFFFGKKSETQFKYCSSVVAVMQQISDSNCFLSLSIYSNQVTVDLTVTIRNLSIYRHVVPSSYCLWLLPASDTSLDWYCTSLSSYQTGPQVWLASCHLSNVYQQVSQHLSDT